MPSTSCTARAANPRCSGPTTSSPTPVLTGAADADDLVTVIDHDRTRWQTSVVLCGPRSHPLDDPKPTRDIVHRWAEAVFDTLPDAQTRPDGRADADLFTALVAEGAEDGNGNTTPTHLHFTTGRQRFLRMARKLADAVTTEHLHQALFGPWHEDDQLPSLRWRPAAERLYALRATDPTKDKPRGVPGAEWLALLGMNTLPTRAVRTRSGRLVVHTTGCDLPREASALRWPLWSPPLGRDTVRSLVGAADLVGHRKPSPATLQAWSVPQVLEAPIRRTGRGRYGSFGAATIIAEAGR